MITSLIVGDDYVVGSLTFTVLRFEDRDTVRIRLANGTEAVESVGALLYSPLGLRRVEKAEQ